MIYDITVWAIMSLILIIITHHLFIFFKDTLTIPKVKDLIADPLVRYKNIEEIINTGNNIGIANIDKNNEEKHLTNTDSDMKLELKNFFNELKQQSSINTTMF